MNKINFESVSKVFTRFFILMYMGGIICKLQKIVDQKIVDVEYTLILGVGLSACIGFIFLVKKIGMIEITIFNSFIMCCIGLPTILYMYDQKYFDQLEGFEGALYILLSTAILSTLILLIRFKFKSNQ